MKARHERYGVILLKNNLRSFEMPSSPDLTSREMEILQLVLAGFTNKAIAFELCISKKTVEFHLDHIYTKIGARTRVMAVIWAVQQGIIEETRVNTS